MASRKTDKKATGKNAAPAKTPAKKPAKRPAKREAANRGPIDRLREICLALPEAHEAEAWGEPTFRVRNKLFAMHASANTHHGAGREAVWIASNHVAQDMVMRAKPDRYFSPPYVGPGGWIGAFLDGKPDWDAIGELLLDAYRQTAPKKLVAKLGDG
jgi:hypothetical protein